MNPLESPTVLKELASVGRTVKSLGAGIERLAAAALQAAEGEHQMPASPRYVSTEEHEVRALWKRLGVANREMLYELARNFDPSDYFTLDDAAESLGIKKGSLRARFMNLGRSTTALGYDAPILWEVDWDPGERLNMYTWNSDAHRAIFRIVDG